jgi:hypothetical protein
MVRRAPCPQAFLGANLSVAEGGMLADLGNPEKDLEVLASGWGHCYHSSLVDRVCVH